MTLHEDKSLSLGARGRKAVTKACRQVVSLGIRRAAEVKDLEGRAGEGQSTRQQHQVPKPLCHTLLDQWISQPSSEKILLAVEGH